METLHFKWASCEIDGPIHLFRSIKKRGQGLCWDTFTSVCGQYFGALNGVEDARKEKRCKVCEERRSKYLRRLNRKKRK